MPPKHSAKSIVAQLRAATGSRGGHHGRRQQHHTTLNYLFADVPGEARDASVSLLNQLLADTITLRDLYKKHQWQVTGGGFYSLHLLFESHCEQQSSLIDPIAERILSLGGTAIAMACDVAETTRIPRPPKGREDVATQLSRLLDAHETILAFSNSAADAADRRGDEGTGDLIAGDIIRLNELQVWFLSGHMAGAAPAQSRG